MKGVVLRLESKKPYIAYIKDTFTRVIFIKKDTRDTITIVTNDTKDTITIVTEDTEDTTFLVFYEFLLSI